VNGDTEETVSVERDRPPLRERIRAITRLRPLEGD